MESACDGKDLGVRVTLKDLRIKIPERVIKTEERRRFISIQEECLPQIHQFSGVHITDRFKYLELAIVQFKTRRRTKELNLLPNLCIKGLQVKKLNKMPDLSELS